MHTSQTVSDQAAQRLELGAEWTHPVVDEALRDAFGRRDDSVREARWVLQRRGEAKSISCQLVGVPRGPKAAGASDETHDSCRIDGSMSRMSACRLSAIAERSD